MYIDDVLLANENETLLSRNITLISTDFEVKNLGFPTIFLGIVILIDENRTLSFYQEQFLKKVLHELKMDEFYSVRNPMLKDNNYFKLIRPDIMFSVNFLA